MYLGVVGGHLVDGGGAPSCDLHVAGTEGAPVGGGGAWRERGGGRWRGIDCVKRVYYEGVLRKCVTRLFSRY